MGIKNLNYAMIRTVDNWVNTNIKGNELPKRLLLNSEQYKQLIKELTAHNEAYDKITFGFCQDEYVGVWISGVPVCHDPNAPELPIFNDEISILMDGI
jgi:hypothetical protein